MSVCIIPIGKNSTAILDISTIFDMLQSSRLHNKLISWHIKRHAASLCGSLDQLGSWESDALDSLVRQVTDTPTHVIPQIINLALSEAS